MRSLFASAAKGLEELVKKELESFGVTECNIVQGGVSFKADDKIMYSCLMWSRFASRILLPLREFPVYSDLDLYAGVNTLRWSTVFDLHSTFAINFSGTNDEIRDSQYGALKVKDAIVDSFMRQFSARPNVDKQAADIRLHVLLRKNNAILSLDLSGDSLHQRGYRQQAGQAPLKENLACAIVQRSQWDVVMPLIDPMCGSGTLLIEAAMIAADIAPGLHRQHWGFTRWKEHNDNDWQTVFADAQKRAKQGKERCNAQFFGYDNSTKMITIAKQNAQLAGVSQFMTFGVQDITQLINPLPEKAGMVISNPPYGERLESEPALIALYTSLGRVMKQQFPGWRLSLFSGSENLLSCLQLRADRQFKANNGPLLCVQKNYRIAATPIVHDNAHPVIQSQAKNNCPDFANRLQKNCKKFDAWAKTESVDCYRIYDSDLPDYNAAIDRYADHVVIQEYAAPKSVDPHKARQRLFDLVNTTIDVLQLPASHVILKTRERQKGKQQYEKLSQKGTFFQVNEYNAKFWVNLTDYLDTGLFLDHRLARKMLGQMCAGKDFLNLFAYTGSATVHAGLGGARSTTTVDMSNTYLAWAERNLSANNLIGRKHRLIQDDCLVYLKESQEAFDVIFIDPPTFSNSKRMDVTFDVQRDHVAVMKYLKMLLRPSGIIMFSNNKRNFKMDMEGLAQLNLVAENITAKTLSADFERNARIHNCWLIQHNEK